MKDKKRNEVFKKTLGVVCITDKIRETKIEMLQSCNKKRGKTLHEKTPQWRSRGRQKKRMGRPDTARHRASTTEK